MDNFIYEFKVDENICDGLIKYHKENDEHKFTGCIVDAKGKSVIDKSWKDSIDVQFYKPSTNPNITKYFDALKIAC